MHADLPRRAARARAWLRGSPRAAASALLLAGLVVLVAFWDWNWFKGPIERAVEHRTGRDFDIGGELDVRPGRVITVSAEQVWLGNAPWAREPRMASAEHVEIDIAAWPLLRGDVQLPHLRLRRPALNLEMGPQRIGNWRFTDDDGSEGPRPRRMHIEAGRLRFLDTARDTDLRVDVASPPTTSRSGSTIVLEGGGRWEGNAFAVAGNAQSPLALRDREAPYRIDLRARAGDTRAHARGTLLDPLRLRGFDLQLALRGATLEDLYPLLGLPLPSTPPYRLEGRLRRDRAVWRYENFKGTVGHSDLAGSVRVDTAGARPMMHADLVSRRLDFDDLAGFVGATPRVGAAGGPLPRRADGRVLPDRPYRLDKLRAMDADVRLRARRINAPGLPLDDMDARLKLKDGVVLLDPLQFGMAGGDLRAVIRMDARTSTLRTQARIAARGLDLDRLLPDVERARDAVGRVGGEVVLRGEGNSIARMLATSNGNVALGMGRGEISNLVIELAGLDVAEALKFLLTEDRRVPVRCAFGDFAVADGVMTARALAFDTTDTIILGEGRIDLREETLALTLRPRPKDRSLFSFRSPLIVDGRLADPRIRPDMKRVGLRAALAVALGSIAPPAALLATLELGPGGNANCGGRYAK